MTDTSIHTKRIIQKSEEEVVINYVDEKSVNIADAVLTQNLATCCLIEKEQMLKPKVKVVDIDNILQMNLKDIEKGINDRNFKNYSMKCEAVHMYSNKQSNLQSVILGIPADIYKNIRENNNKVFVGFQSCRVFDVINVIPSANCAGFGHNSAKCKNKTTCLKCAGAHKTELCNSENNLKCSNCLFSNNKYKTNFNFNHERIDSDMCNILKNKMKKYIDSVAYTVKPKIDRYIGKIQKMESSRQRHVPNENFQRLPQMIKKKFALPTGNPTTANTKTAATHLPQQLHLPQ